MSKEADDLLEAEKAIQELLSELKELKDQIEGYADAREALNQVSRKLGEMVEKTQTLTEATHGAITVLLKIGTPEILSSIKVLNNELREFSNRINESLKNETIESANRTKKLNIKISTSIFISCCSLVIVILILALPFIGI